MQVKSGSATLVAECPGTLKEIDPSCYEEVVHSVRVKVECESITKLTKQLLLVVDGALCVG